MTVQKDRLPLELRHEKQEGSPTQRAVDPPTAGN